MDVATEYSHGAGEDGSRLHPLRPGPFGSVGVWGIGGGTRPRTITVAQGATMTEIIAEERSLLHDKHFAVRQNDGTTYLCDDCGLVWPCPTKRILRALEAAEARAENEAAIVDRVWKALGISTYEQAGGKAIDELVVALRGEVGRLRELRSVALKLHFWLMTRSWAGSYHTHEIGKEFTAALEATERSG